MTAAVTAAEALRTATLALREAGIEEAPRDARRLLAHALDIPPDRVTLILPEPMTDAATYQALIARRIAREPVSKIIGRRDFYGRAFRVTPEVLDPRPETELLVDLALEGTFSDVLDLGTGSGCLLLSLLAERPGATGQGVDVSAPALAVARANADDLGLAGRATFLQGDWFAPVTGRFELIVSNPPYIAASEMPELAPEVRDWDPALALTDQGDGLGAYRAILAGAAAHLVPGGRLIVEIGWQQGAEVAGLFRAAGLQDVAVKTDLAGRDRAVIGRNR
ncbi:peptide chain release factor N(5)-glutamine methyltransferase [Frigidibacter sp. ROC022]|uniref:peptide chain release factor N(5)-glutamine methyltransferase n=1 Tax=Frigidibacter sp. ROC022 TaxID=2971796 RepID=UPI00215ABB9B|nr:peptide chain release factor N(5)-glutamine methyltransferase [Frigidibacter sp. ROC022]